MLQYVLTGLLLPFLLWVATFICILHAKSFLPSEFRSGYFLVSLANLSHDGT